MADPDPEPTGGGEGGGFDLLAVLAFLLSVISSLFTQNKGDPGPLGPSFRFVTAFVQLLP